jgi:hypothetical protein
MQYTNYDEFAELVGMITGGTKFADEEDSVEGYLKSIGAPEPEDYRGFYETDKVTREKLTKFLEDNPDYHLCTVTSDSDEVESEEQMKWWLELNPDKTKEDWEQLCEEDDDFYENFREEHYVSCYTIDNSVRLVNRMGYFLCNGDKDEKIWLCEVERD